MWIKKLIPFPLNNISIYVEKFQKNPAVSLVCTAIVKYIHNFYAIYNNNKMYYKCNMRVNVFNFVKLFFKCWLFQTVPIYL